MLFWLDVDNAPHVLVMRPLIDWLTRAGHRVEVTARDYGQTVPLLDLFGIPFTVVGRHAGRCMYRKVLSFAARSLSLLEYARKKPFAAVFCHGTRGVYLPAKLLHLPLLVMADYEYTAMPDFMRDWARLVLVPEVIPDEAFSDKKLKRCELLKYPGLKEELYVYDLDPDPAAMTAMGIDLERPLVLIRPPASMAHYHVADGDRLLEDVLRHFRKRSDLQVILLPRTPEQAVDLRDYLERHQSPNIRIPDRVGYGPNMIYHSDLVISGGGTMNREAACMGIPVLSIFRGRLGAVDRYLIREGKLHLLTAARELGEMPIMKVPRPQLGPKRAVRKQLVDFIGKTIISVALGEPRAAAGTGLEMLTGR